MKERVNVLLVGNFRINDYGTQALTFALINGLKKYFDAKVTFLISDKNYEEDKHIAEKYGFVRVSYHYPLFFLENKKLIGEIKKNDIIIDADGIEFIGNKSLINRWFHYFATNHIQKLAEKQNKLYIKYTKSYGPFPHKIFNYFVRRVLNKLPFVLVRGEKNTKDVNKLGLDISVYNFPDISIALEPADKNWAENYLEKIGIKKHYGLIGISPSTVLSNIKIKDKNRICGANHIKFCKKNN